LQLKIHAENLELSFCLQSYAWDSQSIIQFNFHIKQKTIAQF